MGKKPSVVTLKDFAAIIRACDRQILIVRENHDHEDDGEEIPTVSVMFDLTIGARATLRYGFNTDAKADAAFVEIQKDPKRLGAIVEDQEKQWSNRK